ncbi:hypothetical protein DICPUDRAFT_53091 [Dictyostelium purpureum]|uniref:Transcription initiation factor IIB n=1 Tax=Dictyostelium purpureum TaxID=5786 RepID=F0ZB51_DICPU|nr:uncharacterized protein DICPUDRAFT_53091 [Dictyostelium purpureum]EGC38858.1 hypothetical protein DICPUDRAFT_53091 [Dictyostelium purpureum]|eukprot:XP_003284652.1 hypothetical protein DICPUDRAFT_53091 [Dictyostelium purpureum]
MTSVANHQLISTAKTSTAAAAAAANSTTTTSTSTTQTKKPSFYNKLWCKICRVNDPDIIEDYAKGDLICRECGVVVGDRIVDEHSEWRTFSNSESTGADPNRVGGPINPLLRDSALSTTIGKGSRDSSSLNRLQNKSALGTGDRNLLAAFKEIGRMADHMNLPQTVQDRANELFRFMDDKKSTKGRSVDGMVAAALYIACRQEHLSRTFKEIAALTNVPKKEISRCYKIMKETFSSVLNLQTISTEDFTSRFCSTLKLPIEVKKISEHVSKTAMDMGIVAGKSPISVTAASIYMVSQLLPNPQDKRTQKQIAEISGVSDVTIRNAYKDLYAKREVLIPQDSPYFQYINSLPTN